MDSGLWASHLHCLPAGAAFVKPHIRQGLLPSILAALVSARKQTRAALKTEGSRAQRAVLDSRQKALKLCANALYGFTGLPYPEWSPAASDWLGMCMKRATGAPCSMLLSSAVVVL